MSHVFILDLKGKVLISRNYKGDIPPNAIDHFMPLLMEQEDTCPPCVTHLGVNYLFVRHANLYFCTLTRDNSLAVMLFQFMHKLIEVFEEYFKELEEESIRDNFVVVYELLDEMMDFGHPQTTETKILQEYITQESFKLDLSAITGIPYSSSVRPPTAVTNAVSWRSEGIKYRRNEVFLDVIESVNLLANSNGNVIQSEINGCVKIRCYLSGMPQVRLGLNDKVLFENTGRTTSKGKAVEMEDVKFHQCVSLPRFESDRTISFIPPDGDFELMSYRLNTQVKPLIWAECTIEHYSGRVEIMVRARAQFKRRSTANNVEIYVPVPEDSDTPKFKSTVGNASYVPEKNAICWKIKQFPGGKEFVLRAHLGRPSVKSEDPDKRPPIEVKFEIPYFTTSGIQVRYLKVIEKSGYQALPWVRYITQNGDYHLRMPEPLKSGTLKSL